MEMLKYYLFVNAHQIAEARIRLAMLNDKLHETPHVVNQVIVTIFMHERKQLPCQFWWQWRFFPIIH